jgi:hypothetical protein
MEGVDSHDVSEHHTVAEVTALIEASLQDWADAEVTGRMPLNEDTLAEFQLRAAIGIRRLLDERGLPDWDGKVVNPRIDMERDALVTDGIAIWPKAKTSG